MPALLPTFAMLGAVLLWGSSASGAKFVLHAASAPEVVAFRIVGAAAVIWTVGLALRRDYRGAGWAPLVMGILEPGLVTFCIIHGLSHTSAVNAAVVWGIMPITQPLLGRLVLREPIQFSVVAGALLALSGTLLLFVTKSHDGTGSLLGDFYLVCGVLCASANQMLARRVATRRGQPIVTTSYQLLSASVLAVGYLLLAVEPSAAYRGLDGFDFAILSYLVLATAGPFMLYNFALQTMNVGRASLFTPLAGPVGVVVATAVFREPVSPPVLAAIVLALSGAVLPTVAAPRRR